MEAVDTTIINTAIPAMSRSLNVNPIDLKIALISYLLSLAIFIPISGWAADKFGVKRVFLSAIVIFTLSSIWCGFVHSLYELVLARTVQGLGGSLMVPVGRLIILRTFERKELVIAMGKVIMMAALGPMLGPVLGGLITHYLSWRWIFWVNIPFGIFAMIMTWRWLEDVPPQVVPKLDKLGFLLFGLGLAGLSFGLSALSESALSAAFSDYIIAASALLLMLYVWHSRHVANPIVNTQLMRFRTFRISILGSLLGRTGFGGVPFIAPLLLQLGLGYSPQLSGFLLAPAALGLMVVKLFVRRLLSLFGYKRFLIFNTILLGLALWSYSVINVNTSLWIICMLTFFYGFLVSLQFSAMNSLAYADLPPENLSAATSIASTMQQLALSFGVALCALLLRYFSGNTHQQFKLTVPMFHHTFMAIGLITALSSLVFTGLKREDGNQLI